RRQPSDTRGDRPCDRRAAPLCAGARRAGGADLAARLLRTGRAGRGARRPAGRRLERRLVPGGAGGRRRVSPAPATHAEVRDWIAGRLDPLEDPMDALLREDIDLDPGMLAPPEVPPAQAAVLIGLIEREAGLSVLLTLRSAELRSHSGQVAFPGGRADPGETPWQAAVREAQEEVGLDPGFVDLVGLSTRFQTRTNYLITPVVGLIR